MIRLPSGDATPSPDHAANHTIETPPIQSLAPVPNRLAVARPQAVAYPTALTEAPTAFGLLKALRKCWLPAFATGLVCAAITAAAVVYFLPPGKYTARTLVRIPTGSYFIKTEEPIQALRDNQLTQVFAAKSRLVLNAALKNEKIAQLSIVRSQLDPIEWLEKELQVDFSVAPEIMRIALSGNVPDELIEIVNAIRNAYEVEVFDKDRIDRTKRLDWLGQRRGEFESKLKSQLTLKHDLEKEAGAKDAGFQAMIQVFSQQKMSWAEQQYFQIKSDLRKAKASHQEHMEADEQWAKAPVSEAAVEEQLTNEPAIRSAMMKVQELKFTIGETLKVGVGGENNLVVKKLRDELKKAEDVLAKHKRESLPFVFEQSRQRMRREHQAEANKIANRIKVLDGEMEQYEEIVEKSRLELSKYKDTIGKLEVVTENTAQYEELKKKIAAEEEALSVELKAPKRFIVMEEGFANRMLDNKRVIMTAVGSGVAALMLVMLGFAWREFRVRRIDSPDQVMFGLGMQLVGTIPDSMRVTKGRGRSTAAKAEEAQSLLAEAVDSTRTMLLRAGRSSTLRVILVTSAQSGEGKTSLSAHLAASLAQIGHSTLLIDGDLRNPIAHRLFDIESAPGFCELLRVEADIADVIRPTAVDQLSMIPAGRWDNQATRALAQDGAKRLLARLREQFDFVIIDSSPVLPVVDPLLFGQNADGVIISVLRDVSRMSNVYATHQRLISSGVKVLGAVVSGVRGELYGATYPYRPYAAST